MSDRQGPQRRFGPQEIERIRLETPLEEIVSRQVKLQRRGREWLGLCPFHSEKTPSFTVVPAGAQRAFYHCFGCSAHGDVIDFVMAVEGCSFVEAMEILGGRRQAVELGRGERAAPRAAPPPSAGAQEQLQRALSIWRAARPIKGTLAELYLARRLGIQARDFQAIGGLPPSLRYHADLAYWAPPERQGRPRLIGRGPALVAAIQGPDRRVIGVHQTWIDPRSLGKRDWRDPADGKALPAKKIRGTAAGGAIRLTAGRAVMGSGEGIETTLAWLMDQGAEAAIGAWVGISRGNLAGPGDPEGERWLHPTQPYDHRGRQRWLLLDPLPGSEARAMALPLECRRWLLIEDHDTRDRATSDALYERAIKRAGLAGVRAETVRAPAGQDWCDWFKERQEAVS